LVGLQANDINIVTVKKMNYQQPVKTDVQAMPVDNKENSGTAVEVVDGTYVGGNLLVVN
jgi:hypothetical protein